MSRGKHNAKKKPTNHGYSAKWSGVSFAPESKALECAQCGKHVHIEGGNYYCPWCDDYVKVVKRATIIL